MFSVQICGDIPDGWLAHHYTTTQSPDSLLNDHLSIISTGSAPDCDIVCRAHLPAANGRMVGIITDVSKEEAIIPSLSLLK